MKEIINSLIRNPKTSIVGAALILIKIASALGYINAETENHLIAALIGLGFLSAKDFDGAEKKE